MIQHVLLILWIERKIGGGIFQDRFLVQIVADHSGNKIIDSLVIGHAVSRGVDDGYISAAVNVHNIGNADQRFRKEGHGIQVFIGYAAVDDADLLLLFPVVPII